MATNFKNIFVGLRFKPVTTLTSDSLGEVQSSSVDNKTYLHNGTTRSPLLTESHSAQLTNKSISADTNTISDLEVDNLKAGVLNTSTVLAGASDLQVPSALAVKTYVDDTFATQTDVEDLVTLTGVPVNSVDLGTFTGTTIPDDQTIKEALQALETGLEAHISDTVDAHDASAISFVPVGAITATDVQAAIAEIDADLTAHIQDATDAHDASAISNIPAGNLVATDVQSALNELQTDIDTRALDSALQAHINDTVDAHDASAISVVPFAGIISTDVQAALVELEAQIAAGGSGDVVGPASSTDNAIARFDGITGKLIQNSVVTVSDTGVIAGASIDADTNTITNIENADIKVGANIDQAKIANLVSDLAAKVDETGGSVITPARLDMKQDTLANLTTYALTATNGQLVFATDTKSTFVIKDGLLSPVGGGGSGELLPSALFQQSFESAVIGDFTQTGLTLLTAPSNVLIKGLVVAQLIHQPATSQSFKQIIAVDRVFRGKLMTISLDAKSTASSGNVTLTVRDETNSVDISSTPITTNSQAISVTTTSGLATLAALSNSVVNTLSVGMSVTGAGIPAATSILSINTVTGVVTLTANATASATVTARFSALPASQDFSFEVPKTCASLSYTITALQEANAPETYIDDVYCQLSQSAMTSTSIVVPKNNDFGPTNAGTITIGATTTAPTKGTIITDRVITSRVSNRLIAEYQYEQSVAGTAGSGEYLFTLPNGLSFDTNSVNFFTGTSFAIASAKSYVGTGWIADNATSLDEIVLMAYDATRFRVLSVFSGTSVAFIGSSSFGLSGLRGYSFTLNAPIAGWSANETETKTIPLTSAVLVTQPDSNLEVQGANGFGSVNTLTRRFSNIITNIGSSVSYVDSATLGASLTILEAGTYNITFIDSGNIASSSEIRVNGIVRTTTTGAVANARFENVFIGQLNVSDVITFTRDSANTGAAPADTRFQISKVGSTKIINPSKDQKIDIPTHSLRFEGASTRGSTDTAIVKFDTLANIRGDGFEVVNTVANGTVVTIKKAGRLTAVTCLRNTSTGMDVYLSKNQNALTISPTLAEQFAHVTSTTATDVTTSGTIDVNIGDKVRVSTGSAPTASATGFLTLSLQENSVAVALSNVLPQFTEGDSAVEVRTANGYGSTNTRIRRFSNVNNNLGSAITYADSVTLGGSFTVNESGLYDISYSDLYSAASDFGITKNTTQPTTNVYQLTNSSEVICIGATTGANFTQTTSTQVYLQKNDVIRAHTSGISSGTNGTSEAKFSISKVGKPNVTVDVTPFVNIKTQDVQAIEALTATTTFGSTNTGVPVLNITKNTSNGIIRVDSSTAAGTSFVALKACAINISATFAGNVTTGGNGYFTRGASVLTATTPDGQLNQTTAQTANSDNILSTTVNLTAGEILRFQRNSTSIINVSRLTLTATASSDSIATPTQQISSDTLPFAFKATAIVDADPIGTFNTYTYAANTNTATISASAPTQTVASMNANGVQVFARAYNAASTTASPARVDIKIGKGLKAKQIDVYAALAKLTNINTDTILGASNTIQSGTEAIYSENSGILTINAGKSSSASVTTRTVDTDGNYSSGYFVFNASTSPVITALPVLQPRIAYLSDVKASGTAGGSAAAATTQTRVLNTLVDSTGIVTSLAANQFTLPRGRYYIEAVASAYLVDRHKIRIRNITDSTTSLIGNSVFLPAGSGANTSVVYGEVTIASPKTFELQHYTQTARATDGLGVPTSTGESEVYSIVKITKVSDL